MLVENSEPFQICSQDLANCMQTQLHPKDTLGGHESAMHSADSFNKLK